MQNAVPVPVVLPPSFASLARTVGGALGEAVTCSASALAEAARETCGALAEAFRGPY